ncbi:MAG: division/cell wall cluster transcriptional repressor MraZ [Candidatus Pacebacteria bacterium]|nr:division/cell wall cluster transcriptional repressor MraZ [Candidatus Paceibacterota bacterium]
MLIGEYTHTLDDKNRLSLPSKFRKVMGKTVVVTPGLDGCLFLFTEAEWRKISGKLSEASLLTADNRSFNRYMFGGATDTPVDTAGRILVPEFLKDRAKLAEKVVLVGVQSRVEIWNETAWKKMKQVFEKEADRLAEKLGEVGVL